MFGHAGDDRFAFLAIITLAALVVNAVHLGEAQPIGWITLER